MELRLVSTATVGASSPFRRTCTLAGPLRTGRLAIHLYAPAPVQLWAQPAADGAPRFSVLALTAAYNTLNITRAADSACWAACECFDINCTSRCFSPSYSDAFPPATLGPSPASLFSAAAVGHRRAHTGTGAGAGGHAGPGARAPASLMDERLLGGDRRSAEPDLIMRDSSSQLVAVGYAAALDGAAQKMAGNPPLAFPSEFSQLPTDALLAALDPPVAAQVEEALLGTWVGTCTESLGVRSSMCNVALQLGRDTVVQHVWGCGKRQYWVGRVLHMDPQMQGVVDPSTGRTCSYKTATVEWTQRPAASAGASAGPVNVTFSASLTESFGTLHSLGLPLQLLYADPAAAGPPEYFSGCYLPEKPQCRRMSLSPVAPAATARLNQLQQPAPPNTDAARFLRCNSSLATELARLRATNYYCELLVKALVLRDWWAPPEPAPVLNHLDAVYPLYDLACGSGPKGVCGPLFKAALGRASAACAAAWKDPWQDWRVGARVLKMLLSLASATYWTTLLCGTNRAGDTCWEALLPLNDRFPFLKALNASDPAAAAAGPGSSCPPLARQSLYGPRFLRPAGAGSWSDFSCDAGCQVAMASYADSLDCCAATVDQAGDAWLATLAHPLLSAVSLDFGDRLNPLNSSLPGVPPLNGSLAGGRAVLAPAAAGAADRRVALRFDSPSPTAAGWVLLDGSRVTLGTGNVSGTGLESDGPWLSARDLVARGLCGPPCAWPLGNQPCCDSMGCVSGFKPFLGACYCDCPDGLQVSSPGCTGPALRGLCPLGPLLASPASAPRGICPRVSLSPRTRPSKN